MTTTTSTRNPITIKAPYYDDAVAMSTKINHNDFADNDDSDGDEFGSFPTDLDFSALDKVIAQRSSEPQQQQQQQQQQQRSAEVIAVLDDDDTDDTRITLRRNSQYSIDIIVIDDSDSDEEEIAEENKDNNDDDIIIGETLTREQLVKRKFDNAVANGQVIVLEGTPTADVAASNSENTIKRRKVDTYSAAFTQRQQQNQNQSQVIISPEKEQGTTTTTATTIDTTTTNLTTSQPVFSSTPTAHLKLPTIFNPYKKHRKVNSQAKAKELDEKYHTQTAAKVMSVSFTKHNTTYGAFHSSNTNTTSKIRNHQKKKRNSIGAASMYCRVASATNDDSDNVGNCDCGNPHKITKGKHLCRYFGTYQCTNCLNRWTSSQCWKNETWARKRCNKNNYPICKDKLDGRPLRKIGSGTEHDSARCSRCRRSDITVVMDIDK